MKQKTFQQNVTKYSINISLQNTPVSKNSLQNSREFALRSADVNLKRGREYIV